MFCRPDTEPFDALLRSHALNTLNKIALYNTQMMFEADLIKKVIVLAEQQLQADGGDGSAKQKNVEEELRQKVLLCIANILLTFANDKVRAPDLPRDAFIFDSDQLLLSRRSNHY